MLNNLIEKLKKVKDQRKNKGKRYPLWFILLIIILTIMQGNLGYREIENFARINQKELSHIVKLKREVTPSYSTIRRVVMGVDWSNLIEIFNEWASEIYPHQEELDELAIDGKSLRSTLKDYGGQSQNFVMIVSLFSQRTGCVLKMKKLENKKESEISQAQCIVRDCQFKGKVITFDALHCNQKTAALVIESGNDYIMALKKNQKKLYEQAQAITQTEKPLSIDINQDVSHGRKITRKVSVYRVNNILHQGWKHLKVVIQIERSGWRGSKPYTEKVYYVSSAMNEAEIFARRIRGHWGIENQYHWVKDVIFQEDKRRISQFQAATNFSILITIVINLFRSWGFLSIKEGQRWLADHWYKIFLLPDLSASKSLR
jgi:predicted transposase YbfD/YdcC